MKRLIAPFATGLLLTLSSASATEIQFEKLNAYFSRDTGSLEASLLYYKGDSIQITLNEELLELRRDEKQFSANKEGIKAALPIEGQGVLSSLDNVEVVSAAGHFLPGEVLAFKADHLSAAIGDGVQTFDQLLISCRRFDRAGGGLDLHWLIPCQEQGFFSLPTLRLDKNSVSSVSKAIGIEKGIDKLNDVQMVISRNAFLLSFEAKYLFNWKVKATGTVVIDQVNNQVQLKLISAKAGIFGIKSKLLSQLAKSNIKNISVNGDLIVIQL
ncbi:MAG: hypothetical protein COW00_20260 [Bdellovibrio sp. CG12_big_fil_rev_8_21_14_0_65_39_13]|nr:MAG: hypothetical protein COW78_15470 [Bdellovibrio sp. CG22_combo_CG10-13_8_21_14_all_39_27]PIQ57564.1 MAG: hypothetical protein COW00_20260 [Bdellovibrio sp. CG12_big_fil_rev_8_21_14_0_65_39_13]PIR33767.1 MAG: hypothetical protein COV37_15350 [Bdellovibrio sp. CG11_big_fil_rev_8_21_14_0_20_39_38]PJB52355.1 MAG: hypothetical protein CO099_13095 [Bdellovibrio sp. CG_4_9_14_3_um_filter_39_7]